MMPVRRLIEKVQAIDLEQANAVGKGRNAAVKTGPHVMNSKNIGVYGTVDADALIKSDPISMEDLILAMNTTRKSSNGNIMQYEKWQSEFGSV